MTRITLTKKQKAEFKHIETVGSLKKELLSFHNLDALNSNEPSSKKMKKMSSKNKKKGKGKKGKKLFFISKIFLIEYR